MDSTVQLKILFIALCAQEVARRKASDIARLKEWNQQHPERAKERQSRYNKTEKAKLKYRRYCNRHPDKRRETYRKYEKSAAGVLRANKWRVKNPDKCAAMRKAYNAANPDKVKKWASDSQKRRYATPIGKLIVQARVRIRHAVKSQGTRMPESASKLLGCDWATFKRHIESKLLPGMTMENYGQWHVDHIRPVASFDLRDPEQMRQCFSYVNTQPLWASDNRRKGDKYNPALV